LLLESGLVAIKPKKRNMKSEWEITMCTKKFSILLVKICVSGRWVVTNVALQNGHEIENREKLLVLKLYLLIKLK
jgi:hypothetical protein